MMERNWFDEAARVLAMPIPRRKALKYVMTALAGGVLSLGWPKQAAAIFACRPCGSSCTAQCCTQRGCKPCPGRCICEGNYSRCKAVHLQDIPSADAIPDVAITREASLAAGNCTEGTHLIASWFPGKQSVTAREIVAASIDRGKHELLPLIAHTAWSVYWSTAG